MSKKSWVYKQGKKFLKERKKKKEKVSSNQPLLPAHPPMQSQIAPVVPPPKKERIMDYVGYKKPEIDFHQLQHRCYQSMLKVTEDAVALGGVVTNCTNGEWFVHIKRGSKVLAVSHLDTVRQPTHFARTKPLDNVTPNTFDRVYCETLDDRLGVYTILDVLPLLGIQVDVLLTTGEETGKTSAKFFTDKAEYNWIVEFDRRGEDAVLYEYEDDKDWDTAIEASGFEIGNGSFSDIGELEDLGISAFNVGLGYENEHSYDAFMVPAVYARQIQRFNHFFYTQQNTRYIHVKSEYTRWNGNAYRGEHYYDSFGWWGANRDSPAVSNPPSTFPPPQGIAGCDYCSVSMSRMDMTWSEGLGWMCPACARTYRTQMDQEEPEISPEDCIVCPVCDEYISREEVLYYDRGQTSGWECPLCLGDITDEMGVVPVNGNKQGSDDPATEERVEAWRNSTGG